MFPLPSLAQLERSTSFGTAFGTPLTPFDLLALYNGLPLLQCNILFLSPTSQSLLDSPLCLLWFEHYCHLVQTIDRSICLPLDDLWVLGRIEKHLCMSPDRNKFRRAFLWLYSFHCLLELLPCSSWSPLDIYLYPKFEVPDPVIAYLIHHLESYPDWTLNRLLHQVSGSPSEPCFHPFDFSRQGRRAPLQEFV